MHTKDHGSNWIINKPLKTKTSTILFALFFGGFGVHRYYLEHYWRFFFSLLFCWTFIPAIVALIDVVMFAAMPKGKFDEKYNNPYKPYHCSGCDIRLTFWNLPVFGGGKLKNGGQICLKCFREISKKEGFLEFNSRNYDGVRVRQIINIHTMELPPIPEIKLPPIPQIDDEPQFSNSIVENVEVNQIIPVPEFENISNEAMKVDELPIVQVDNTFEEIVKEEALNIPEEKEASLEDALNELNSLIGLREIKWEINKLIDSVKIRKNREEMGLRVAPEPYHIVFTGNPGTGKKTAARIVAKIFKHLDILTQGHLVECDRMEMGEGNPEQIIVNLNKIIDSAPNGVLFFDEANALSQLDDVCKKEVIATLIKRMEDDKNKFIVILAARTKEIRRYSDMDPAFRACFNRYINFPDYKPHELEEIQKRDFKKNNG